MSEEDSVKGILGRNVTFRQTEEGYIEEYDIETGTLLRVHGDVGSVGVANDTYHELELSNGKTIMVSPNVKADNYIRRQGITFSWALVDIICQRIREGASLTRLCREEGFPSYSLLCDWRRMYPEIEGKLEQAREDRGEYYADELIELRYLEPVNKTQADDKRTNVDILKFGAEKGNRARYGNSTKVEVSGKVSHAVMIVETGVRKNLEGAIVDETAKIREAEKIVDEGGEDDR